MNAPDRYERFVVPEGTKKVSYERDTKIVNAASFTVEREDHTIGNILRMQLHRDPNVLFAGYKLPHPLQYKIIVRAYSQAIDDLDKELDYLKKGFEQWNVVVTKDSSTIPRVNQFAWYVVVELNGRTWVANHGDNDDEKTRFEEKLRQGY